MVAINAALIAAVVRFRARRDETAGAERRRPRRRRRGRRGARRARPRDLRPRHRLHRVDPRRPRPSGPDGLQAAATRTAQVNVGRPRPPTAPDPDDQRDRPAVAVALRVPGEGVRRPDLPPCLLLRGARRPRGHDGDPQRDLDRRRPPLVGARRWPARSTRSRARSRRPGSRPTRPGDLRGPLLPVLRARLRDDADAGRGRQRRRSTRPGSPTQQARSPRRQQAVVKRARPTTPPAEAVRARMTPADPSPPPAPRSSPASVPARAPRLDPMHDRDRPQAGRRCSTSCTALVALVLAVTLLVLMRVQLIVPENTMIYARHLRPADVGLRRDRDRLLRAAAGDRPRHLRRAAPDRRARRRPPAPRRDLVLALRCSA